VSRNRRSSRPHGPTIGVLTPLAGGHYFGSLLCGVARSAAAAGGHAIAIQTLEAGLAGMENVATPDYRLPVADGTIDGYVVVLNGASPDYLHELQERGKPVVVVSHEMPGLVAPIVAPDNAKGVREAVLHLLSHGHTSIAFVGAMTHADVRERHAAYEATLRTNGIEPDAALFYGVDNNAQVAGREAGERMLADGLPCTATVAATDLTAIGVIEALNAAGLNLPRDHAIIGFDNLELGSYVTPPLSTVSQRFDLIGSAATELVLAQLRGEAVAPLRYTQPTAFVPRQSCGCEAVLRIGAPVFARPTERGVTLGDRLVEALVDRGSPAGTAHAVRSAATTLERAASAVTRGGSGPTAAEVDAAWQTLYRAGPDESQLAAVIREIRDVARPNAGSSIVVENFILESVLALTRVQVRAQMAGAETLRTLLRTQYDVGMDLLRSHEEDPRALGWMTGTSARAACFAEWVTPPGGGLPTLRVVGTYAADGTAALEKMVGLTCTTAEFPPQVLTDAHGVHADEILYVVPVNANNSDWGMLAVIGPVETDFAQGRETFNLWAGLLSVTLDHESVMQSLRVQREEVAQAYHRERDLVEEIRVSEQRYALAARAANDGLWDWDFATGTIYYSPRWKALLGYAEDAIGDDPDEWFSRIHADDRPGFELSLERHRNDPGATMEYECRIRAADGAYLWMLCRGLAIPDPDGPVNRMVGSLTDVTDRKELEEQLRHDALYDDLTGLPNRTLFIERLDRAVELAKRRTDYRFAVLFLDLDGFKVVNDSLGHLAGDELLIGIAGRLQGALRTNDTAARFGGDEFAVLLNDVRRTSDITLVAERLQEQLSMPFTLDGHQVVVSAGIGIAVSSTGYVSAEDVLRDADIAMYRAKGSGNGAHVVFDVGMHERAVRRLQLETGLRRAIEREEFVLHYQPIVRLGDQTVCGYEALLRWQSPEHGLVSPAEFLPMAEETGLIVPIGRWVLETAAAQVARWRSEGRNVAVSVNISNRQFWHGDIVEQVRDVLSAHLLDPSALRIEITEGVVMHKPGPAERILHDLAAHGVALDVDDFGTGYSSLEVLHRFPISALKIDRSFIVRIEEDSKSGELVRAIVMMASSLGMEVVAEGIETSTQDAYLRALGCSYGQGFLYGRPRPANEIGHVRSAPGLTPTAL
jgi:diguanylate cyclase (GGDEF)-like protein/PAS domain S-box-containing protein